jgi:HTH-type transcriptional regulator / antitoxin HigA
MQTVQTKFDMPAIQSSWVAFEDMMHLRPIHDDAGYDQMVALMDSLLDVVGENENHKLSGLLELVGDMIAKYDNEHFPIAAMPPKDSLRFLIEARGLTQEDLSVIVPQSNLSAILAGKRKISATLAGKLGKFFGVNAALFVPR